MPTATCPVEARGLCYAHDGHDVLHDVSVSLPAGTVTAIAGPNGAGKSTLVELVAGVRRPRRGVVHRQGTTALVVQRPSVPDTLPVTVLDVVRMGTWARGHGRPRPSARSRAAARGRVHEVIERVGLGGLEQRRLSALSGGQRQRVLLAQGLVQQAEVLLLDEPAAGLDAASREAARRILAEEAALRGVAVACVTHDEESIRAADRVVRLEDGRVVP